MPCNLHLIVSSDKVTAPTQLFSWCHASWQQFVSIAIKNANNLQIDIHNRGDTEYNRWQKNRSAYYCID